MRPLAECHGALSTAISLSVIVFYIVIAIQDYRCVSPFHGNHRCYIKRVFTTTIEPPKLVEDRVAHDAPAPRVRP